MKRILFTISAVFSLSVATMNAQSVSYSLPRTSLSFEVHAVKESFHAGPYAKFASKYLGVEASEQSFTSYRISDIKMTPYMEADPSTRFSVVFPKGRDPKELLEFTSQGLIAVADGTMGKESVWRFPSTSQSDFSSRGVSSNLTSATATLYQNVKKGTSHNKVSIQQNMVIEKSTDQKASEAAEMIFKLRAFRIRIVTGDTDASYSGEAMASALKELSDLEEEYLSLFVGYSEYQEQVKRFDVVPDSDNLISVAFRVSDTDGLVSSDNVSGKPVIIQIAQDSNVQIPVQSAKGGIRYRVPAVCTVKLSDGVKSLLEARVPVYQLGSDFIYPLL